MKSILIFFVTMIFSITTFGFTLTSSSNPDMQGWADPNVQLMVNTTNCPAGVDVPGLVSEAAKVWNNIAGSSVKVSYGGSTASTTFSSPPTVYCETNFQVVTGADQNFVPGAASVNVAGGRIVSGLIILNASVGSANIGVYNQTILKIVMSHEMGHLLGLGHSESVPALMYYSVGSKKSVNLAQDDIDGMSYLYPSNELNSGKIAGCGLVRNLQPPSNSQNLIWLFLLLLIPFFISIELRKKIHLSN